jgi:hypothetical protein
MDLKTNEGVAAFFTQMHDRFGYVPKKWAHKRHLFASASQIGLCAKKQKYMMERGGVVIDDDRPEAWGVFARGDTSEEWHVGVCHRAQLDQFGGPETGLKFQFLGEDQITVIDDARRLSATPDGIMWLRGEPILLEFKSIDPRVTLDGPKDQHRRQVLFGMGLMNDVHEIKPRRALIVYLDCSNYAVISTFLVDYDEVEIGALIDRAMLIHNTPLDEVTAEGAVFNTGECGNCQFAAMCKEGVAAKAETLDEDTRFDEETLELIDELADKRWRAMHKENLAKIDKDDSTGKIRMMLDGANAAYAMTERYSIRQSHVAGRETCDWKRAIADGVDLSDYVSRSNGSVRLSVRRRTDV